jgi:hypothetical protein
MYSLRSTQRLTVDKSACCKLSRLSLVALTRDDDKASSSVLFADTGEEMR